MKSFWLSLFNIVFGTLMGNIVMFANNGTRAEAVILSLIFIVWLDIRTNQE
jgi:hypothetical protein